MLIHGEAYDRPGNFGVKKYEGKQWKNNLYNFYFDNISKKEGGPALQGERYLWQVNMALYVKALADVVRVFGIARFNLSLSYHGHRLGGFVYTDRYIMKKIPTNSPMFPCQPLFNKSQN